ncbi:Gag polyprotein [Bienertia sinuspersici]
MTTIEPTSPLYIHPSDGTNSVTVEKLQARQNEKSVSDYYTEMKGIWEELEVLNTLPAITNMNPEVMGFIGALNKQMEEQKLFQFLHGLSESNTAIRSHVLMMTNLPSVEEVCAMIQQEETQRVVLKAVKEEPEPLAMYGKSSGVVCESCGKMGHLKKDCWTPKCEHCGRLGHLKKECYHIVGFPDSSDKQGGKGKEREFIPGFRGGRGGRWNKGGRSGRGGVRGSSKTAANVQMQADPRSASSAIKIDK